VRRETKNLPKNEISAATRINLESCQSNKTCYSIPTKTRKKIEIFREHMIENLYLDLTEETKDQMIYGKLFQDCKSAAEELFRADRVNELQREMTPLSRFDVPEVLEVQVVALSEEVRICPPEPTATKLLFT